jgi:hypothetical protein
METYHGGIETPQDALILFEACRLGLLPPVLRRLSKKDLPQVKAGSVYVWDENVSGIKRWTDGKSWSTSRVSGYFMIYTELEGKCDKTSLKRNHVGLDGELNGQHSDKSNGLVKQTFSIIANDNRKLHLVSYHDASRSQNSIKRPSTDPTIENIELKGMYPEPRLLSAPASATSMQNSKAVSKETRTSSSKINEVLEYAYAAASLGEDQNPQYVVRPPGEWQDTQYAVNPQREWQDPEYVSQHLDRCIDSYTVQDGMMDVDWTEEYLVTDG